MSITMTIQIEAINLQDAFNQLRGADLRLPTGVVSVGEDVATSPPINKGLLPAAQSTSTSALPAVPPDEPVAASDKPAAPPDEPVAAPDDAPTYSLPEVRAVLADLRKAKNAAAAKAILEAHGANALSELDESKYAAVIKAAQEAMK